MEMGLIIGGVISALFLGFLALAIGIYAMIKIIAVESSTHTVQMVPVDEEIDRANKDFMNKWATGEEAIKRERKLYQEELEDEMPEFALSDEDKETFSL